MKAGWEVKALGEVATIINGGTPKSEVATYWDGDVDWLTPKDMGKLDGHLVHVTPRRISREGLAKCSARQVPAQSVIMSTRAPIGHLAMNTVPMAFNQGCRGMVPGEKLDAKYLFHVLSANVQALDDLGTGTTFKELSAGSLKAFPIPLPPLDEQKRIVAVLDVAFDGLSRARAHTETNLQNARELFESYSDAIFSGKEQNSPLTTIGKAVEVFSGFAFKSSQYVDDPLGIRLVRGDNIVQGRFRWEDVKRWPAEEYEDYSRFQLRAGDILLAMDRTWVKDGVKFTSVSEEDTPSLLVQRVARLRCGMMISSGYLSHLIGSKLFEKYVISMQAGLGVPHISGKQIQDFEFALPPLEEQATHCERLDQFLQNCETLQSHYRAKLADLDALRQSLLQKAFAGQLT